MTRSVITTTVVAGRTGGSPLPCGQRSPLDPPASYGHTP